MYIALLLFVKIFKIIRYYKIMTLEKLIDDFQNNPSNDKRRQAAEDIVANNMYNDVSIYAFANGLLDSDQGIRDVSQRALLNTPDEYKANTARAVAPYINTTEIELRNAAGEILTKMDEYAVKILLPYLKSKDFDVRKFACDILGLIGDEEIIEYIIPLLNDPDKNAMLSAIETLGNLRAASALDAMIMVYENFDEVKPFVIEAIGKIGGENSESYLLEQLEIDTNDTFLQTTIIDALAYNAKNIDISYKLLRSMPNCKLELQKIMLTTAFAIAFRLDTQLIMPDELRYVSHLGLKEKDKNIMIASLISLGNKYDEKDVLLLLDVVLKNIPELNQQILYNLVVNSATKEVTSFLNEYLSRDMDTESNCDFLEYLNLFWDEISQNNKIAIMDAIIFCIEQNYNDNIMELVELIYDIEPQQMREKLEIYINETTEENRKIITEFLGKRA